MKKRSINLIFDPSKKVKKVDFMNTIAGVCQIIHSDPSVGTVDFQFAERGKIKHTFSISIK